MSNILARYKAVLFDLDGTLVDSNELHVESWDRAFHHFGKCFTREALREQVGKGSDKYLPEFLTAEERERFGEELDEFRSQLFQREYLPRVQGFPKVRALCEHLRSAGQAIVLATSGKKPEARHYVELLQIERLIDGQTTADDAESSKPAPDIFVAALAQLDGISAAEAVVIGETPYDMEAARRAGLDTTGFLCGGTANEKTLRAEGAMAVYRAPAYLLQALGADERGAISQASASGPGAESGVQPVRASCKTVASLSSLMESKHITEQKNAIRARYACESLFIRTVEVPGEFGNVTPAESLVSVFELVGHPQAPCCYAWSRRHGEKAEIFSVLQLPPVTTPLAAVHSEAENTPSTVLAPLRA
ncbi:MAG: HAD family hydrolase [Chthoniobacterales bacterium]